MGEKVYIVDDVLFNTGGGMRTLIYGVKDGGIGLAKSIRSSKPNKFTLKGFIAHDSTFKGRILMGEKVYIVDDDLAEIIRELKIKAVQRVRKAGKSTAKVYKRRTC